MTTLNIHGKPYRGDIIPLTTSAILVIQGCRGMLGCGYLSLATAERLGHALAIVTGVASFDDMLKARVTAVSTAAAALGVSAGMTGEEALELLG